MQITSMVAIYMLFWVMSAFLVMPFGLRAHSDAGEEEHRATLVPGTVESAPVNFRPGRIALRATLLSAVLFGLFYLNFRKGWVTIEDVSLIHPPASVVNKQY
jgi:predicted secreted protein